MIYVATHRGKGKAESEDAVLVGSQLLSETSAVLPCPSEGFICVADGVGGHGGGRLAARFILHNLGDKLLSEADTKSILLNANQALINEFSISNDYPRMATTLTGIRLKGQNAQLFHVGNTRAYRMQGTYLKQITSDHTVYNYLLSVGQLEKAEKCNRSEIVSCLGGGDVKLADRLIVSEQNRVGTILLTSDGIHDYVSIDDLENMLSCDRDKLEICESIITAAQNAGSMDDLSVVLICTQEE